MKKQKRVCDYTPPQIQTMRERLHEAEWEGLRDKDLREILWDGCLGWSMMNDEDVIDKYITNFGEDEL